jgi:hypothetical protein
MIKKRVSPHAVFFLLFMWMLPLFSCAGKPEIVEEKREEIAAEIPAEPAAPPVKQADGESGVPDFSEPSEAGDMVFIASSLPPLTPAPGVGNITRELRDKASGLSGAEKEALSASFRGAYIDGILRGLPLAGVLGGDLVHSWPENDPSAWVQNWRITEPRSNSWGISLLILAVRNINIAGEMEQNRVRIIQGGVLDFYGKSEGRGGANGDAGYGSPRGDEFLYNGGTAQRFELGVIVVDENGKASFLPGAPPSEDVNPPSEVGVFASPPPGNDGRERDAFLAAWKMALDRTIEAGEIPAAMVPDGTGTYVSFSAVSAAESFGLPPSVRAKGLYTQTFNQKTALLVLIDTDDLPCRARLVLPPFLDILLSPETRPVSGSGGLPAPDADFPDCDDFTRRLMKGFTRYGLPLTDPLPGLPDDTAYQREAQRFTRGWLAVPARPAEF